MVPGSPRSTISIPNLVRTPDRHSHCSSELLSSNSPSASASRDWDYRRAPPHPATTTESTRTFQLDLHDVTTKCCGRKKRKGRGHVAYRKDVQLPSNHQATAANRLMAVVALCESRDLFNLLSQRVAVSRLAEINYLCLIDARERQDYDTSHIITARHAKTNQNGAFLPLESVEIDTMQNIVIYDGRTDSLDVPGGFEKFSALYPFLRTEKIMYTIKELEDVRSYPVEIIPQRVYMGSEEQSLSRSMMDDLKIKAVVCISARDMPVWNKSVHRLDVEIEADKEELCFEEICNFVDSHSNSGSRVLIVSLHGFRRCSTAATAYLMHHYKYSLQEAWTHVQRCKHNVVFDKRFTDQLSDWEKRVTGKTPDPQ